MGIVVHTLADVCRFVVLTGPVRALQVHTP
jgi:hypothetical protein